MDNRTVVVIGGGPAGTCAAMALAKLGANVTVYEQKSQDKFVSEDGEPYAIVLEKRGLDALEEAGFLDVDFHGSEYASATTHVIPSHIIYTVNLRATIWCLSAVPSHLSPHRVRVTHMYG